MLKNRPDSEKKSPPAPFPGRPGVHLVPGEEDYDDDDDNDADDDDDGDGDGDDDDDDGDGDGGNNDDDGNGDDDATHFAPLFCCWESTSPWRRRQFTSGFEHQRHCHRHHCHRHHCHRHHCHCHGHHRQNRAPSCIVITWGWVG